MKQLNLNVTPEFARDMRQFMKARRVRQKSEAIRIAMREAAERAQAFDFSSLVGIALRGPQNPRPRFHSDDDLWRAG